MKLYSDVHRIYTSLAAQGIGPDDPLRLADLTPHDQYHYHGTEAVDLAAVALGLPPGASVLDIGSGIGGPARHLAATVGLKLTALELQADLDQVARDLTARCGLGPQVKHVCGNILNGAPGGPYDGAISMLCMLHIPDKPALFAATRAALKPGATLYIEDFARARSLTPDEETSLAVKVQSVGLPTPAEYHDHLRQAGFADVQMQDVTADWQQFSARRLHTARENRAVQIALHGPTVTAGLEDFYAAVDALWQGGALTGLRIIAR